MCECYASESHLGVRQRFCPNFDGVVAHGAVQSARHACIGGDQTNVNPGNTSQHPRRVPAHAWSMAMASRLVMMGHTRDIRACAHTMLAITHSSPPSPPSLSNHLVRHVEPQDEWRRHHTPQAEVAAFFSETPLASQGRSRVSLCR